MEYEAVLEMVVAIARQSSESMGTGSMGRKSADLLEGLAMLTIADFDDSDLLSYFDFAGALWVPVSSSALLLCTLKFSGLFVNPKRSLPIRYDAVKSVKSSIAQPGPAIA